MKGVNKSSKNRWRVGYGRLISEYYNSEKEAKIRRKTLEKKYGIPKGRRKKVISFENKHFKYVGDTDKTSKDGKAQLDIFLNKHSKKYEVRRFHDVASGQLTGINNHFSHTSSEHPGVIKKGNLWQAQIGIDCKKYTLGTFKNLSDAQKKYQKALKNFLTKKELPVTEQHAQVNSETGVKNVHFQHSENKYRFKKTINGKTYFKRFNTLNEAVTYRNNFLKEHNLPIPKD